MKASLSFREPQVLKFWEESDIYAVVQKKSTGKPKYLLHDGPPYSNGRIHLGQALNKILKDIVVKFKGMRGYDAPYVPGWDTHGLPNELQAIKSYQIDRKAIDPLDLRGKCADSAVYYVGIQRDQFRRLGVRGDWERPYLTLDHSYEAAVVRGFASLVRGGYVERKLKPVYWCCTCETSLAEAEIEYKDKTSPSIYVRFPVKEESLSRILGGVNGGSGPLQGSPGRESQPGEARVSCLVWTTTPWTLPGNVAIALHPHGVYSLIRAGEEYFIVADPCWDATRNAAGITEFEVVRQLSGKELEGMKCRHPFLDRDSVMILQEYVTMDQGTGCVHTAPGHGREDYEAALEYSLPIVVPVDHEGILTEGAGPFQGLSCEAANEKIVQHLRKEGYLLHSSSLSHAYPHCWRCRNPVIFRATEQWFVVVDAHDLRKRALEEIKKVKWYPSWGEERMAAMLKDRPDWCISRQRVWGVPLPIFYCKVCQKPVLTEESLQCAEHLFLSEGSDAWFKYKAEEILPRGFTCPHCGKKEGFRKEKDIFDVWFESGVSHLAVLETREELGWPCDLYLEGSDQHRGWFQVSLLSGMGVHGRAPYREVLTHGWVLDEEGKTMHKSLGNVIDPMDIVQEYGADVLRLFISSVEFKNDMKVGEEGLKQIGEVYRKIRNTCRFLLGNLYDFDPRTDGCSSSELLDADRWALAMLNSLIRNVTASYDSFEFHLVYMQIHTFCVNEMSAIYLDMLKDRLYTYPPASRERRSAQTALCRILLGLAVLMFPILSFTAEEIWQSLPLTTRETTSVQLCPWPEPDPEYDDPVLLAKWERLLRLKQAVYAAIEEARQKKVVRQSLDACVEISLLPQEYQSVLPEIDQLRSLLIVSQVRLRKLEPGGGEPSEQNRVGVRVTPAAGEKCKRCWNWYEDLGGGAEARRPAGEPSSSSRVFDPTFGGLFDPALGGIFEISERSDLCHRCAQTVEGLSLT